MHLDINGHSKWLEGLDKKTPSIDDISFKEVLEIVKEVNRKLAIKNVFYPIKLSEK